MTDEEKASIRDLLKTADIYLSERQTNILCRAFELSITKGYEQGLAEGKPKWHDLRKDPNDLPTESGNYWGYVYYYGFQHRKLWWSDNQFDVSEVIAWCELPKFEEK